MKNRDVLVMLFFVDLAIILYVVGMIFFDSHARYFDSSLNSIYNLMGLFFHDNLQVENPDYSVFLQLASIAAPLVVLVTVGSFIYEKSKDEARLWKIKHYSSKKTVVVFGLGGRGFPYVLSCIENKQKVIVIESNRDNPYLDAVKRAGAAVLIGDAGRDAKSLLDKASIKNSSKLALFTGDNGLNISVAMIASKMTEDAGDDKKLEIICHVDNPSASRLIGEYSKFSMGKHSSRIRFVNAYELSAKELFDDFPPETYADLFNQETVDIAIYGFGKLGLQVLLEGCRRLHFLNLVRPQFHVFDKDASMKEKIFLDQNPGIKNIADVTFINLDLEGYELTKTKLVDNPGNPLDIEKITLHIICFPSYPNADNCMITAFSLRNTITSMKNSNAPILVRLEDDQGAASILESNAGIQEFPDGLYPVAMFSRVLDWDSIHNETEIDRAKYLHKHVYSGADDEEKTKSSEIRKFRKPSSKVWNELAWHYRQSNIYAIQYIPTRLRAMLLSIHNKANSGNEQETDLCDYIQADICGKVMERLAEVEHVRWNASHWIKGWMLPSLEDDSNNDKKLEKDIALKAYRSDVARQHNCLVEWSELSSKIQKYDRDSIKEVVDVIQKTKSNATVFREYRVAILALPGWIDENKRIDMGNKIQEIYNDPLVKSLNPHENEDCSKKERHHLPQNRFSHQSEWFEDQLKVIKKYLYRLFTRTSYNESITEKREPLRAFKLMTTLSEGASLWATDDYLEQNKDCDVDVYLPVSFDVYKESFGHGPDRKDLEKTSDKSINVFSNRVGRKDTSYFEMPFKYGALCDISVAANSLFSGGCPSISANDWWDGNNIFCQQFEMTLARMVERADEFLIYGDTDFQNKMTTWIKKGVPPEFQSLNTEEPLKNYILWPSLYSSASDRKIKWVKKVICGNQRHLDTDAKALLVQKKAIPVGVVFAESAGICKTKEGDVAYKAGEAILTGVEGEQWPVERAKFDDTYEPISPTKAGENGKYVKRPIEVYALQMNDPFYVDVSWEAGRLEGKPGDWLLQYGSDDYGVVSQSIFGKTYEIISNPHV